MVFNKNMYNSTMNLEKEVLVTSQYKEYIKLLIQKYEKDLEDNLLIISETRSQGDLKENSAYHQARDYHDQIENDIETSQQYLLKKEYADKDILHKDYIDFGASFKIEVGGKSCNYLMLDDPESNFEKNIISRQSPIGQLFLGKKYNDIMKFPNHVLNYPIKINRGKIERGTEPEELIIKEIKYINLNNIYDGVIKDLKDII
jgi:transcription elongation GreA/GreB family factor